MVEEVSIAGLRAKKAAKQGRILAGVQSVVIFLLLVFVAEEYDHNEYLQAWAGIHLGALGFLLNGTLAAFYAGVLIAVHFNRPAHAGCAQKGAETGGDSCCAGNPVRREFAVSRRKDGLGGTGERGFRAFSRRAGRGKIGHPGGSLEKECLRNS